MMIHLDPRDDVALAAIQIGMVAGFTSEQRPASNRNPRLRQPHINFFLSFARGSLARLIRRGWQMQILVIEDDPAVSRSVALMLETDTCSVRAAGLGEEGVELAKLNGYSIILLDLNLPDCSGYEVLRALRTAGVNTPVLILSGLNAIADKVKGFEFGADDYLTKPFHKDELLARVHAVVRRADRPAETVVQCGDLVIYLEGKRAEIAGQPVPLTKKEFEVLELLALRHGMAISKETFLNHIYGGRDEPGQKIVDVFLCKLRKKLAAISGGTEYIETVWGRGYMLREPERLRDAA